MATGIRTYRAGARPYLGAGVSPAPKYDVFPTCPVFTRCSTETCTKTSHFGSSSCVFELARPCFLKTASAFLHAFLPLDVVVGRVASVLPRIPEIPEIPRNSEKFREIPSSRTFGEIPFILPNDFGIPEIPEIPKSGFRESATGYGLYYHHNRSGREIIHLRISCLEKETW